MWFTKYFWLQIFLKIPRLAGARLLDPGVGVIQHPECG